MDTTIGWFGTAVGNASPALPTPDPLLSKQYGPAWVATMYGTTHEQRVEALNEAGWTILPSDRDHVAKTYARLMTEGS